MFQSMTFLVKMHVTDAHFTHFAGSTKLPGFTKSGTLIANGLKMLL